MSLCCTLRCLLTTLEGFPKHSCDTMSNLGDSYQAWFFSLKVLPLSEALRGHLGLVTMTPNPLSTPGFTPPDSIRWVQCGFGGDVLF